MSINYTITHLDRFSALGNDFKCFTSKVTLLKNNFWDDDCSDQRIAPVREVGWKRCVCLVPASQDRYISSDAETLLVDRSSPDLSDPNVPSTSGEKTAPPRRTRNRPPTSASRTKRQRGRHIARTRQPTVSVPNNLHLPTQSQSHSQSVSQLQQSPP
ncbi:hypothetical protein L596_020698 [Steinernema carpocapsae]|uniref:Uncharacterized protein n=1 Tax=Steinernema carpocapsae TaxID=34508 RepID=A0A4V6A0Z2_STECR|nr:hypothetical protein L596_020698 [Steinernema carpocapsae]